MKRKGERSARDSERRYPHRVAVVVPPGGFGRRLGELHAAIEALGAPIANGRGFRRDDRDYCVWCFADAATAAAFAQAVGGEVMKEGTKR